MGWEKLQKYAGFRRPDQVLARCIPLEISNPVSILYD